MSPRPRKASTATPGRKTSAAPAREPASQLVAQQRLINRLTKIVGVQRTARSSVQLERGPRGQVLITVNVHQGDEPGLSTVAAVKQRATEIFDELAAQYPAQLRAGDGGEG